MHNNENISNRSVNKMTSTKDDKERLAKIITNNINSAMSNRFEWYGTFDQQEKSGREKLVDNIYNILFGKQLVWLTLYSMDDLKRVSSMSVQELKIIVQKAIDATLPDMISPSMFDLKLSKMCCGNQYSLVVDIEFKDERIKNIIKTELDRQGRDFVTIMNNIRISSWEFVDLLVKDHQDDFRELFGRNLGNREFKLDNIEGGVDGATLYYRVSTTAVRCKSV